LAILSEVSGENAVALKPLHYKFFTARVGTPLKAAKKRKGRQRRLKTAKGDIVFRV
jgi:hypothetical protein